MTFVKFNDKWWELRSDNTRFRLYDRKEKRFNIDLSNQIVMVEYENWHDLYKHEHFSWMLSDISTNELWIDQDGNYWGGECHETDAQYILEDVFGINMGLLHAGDALIKAGWIKIQTSLMTQYYAESGMYDNLTTAQYISLNQYCKKHGIPLSFYGLSETIDF